MTPNEQLNSDMWHALYNIAMWKSKRKSAGPWLLLRCASDIGHMEPVGIVESVESPLAQAILARRIDPAKLVPLAPHGTVEDLLAAFNERVEIPAERRAAKERE